METVFAWFGNLDEHVSDNGPQFISSEFSEFLRKHGIAHTHSVVYNPTENGLVQVFNRVLKYGVQCFRFNRVSWEDGIQELLRTYRATSTRTQSQGPTELFISHCFRLDFELVSPLVTKANLPAGGAVTQRRARLKWGPFSCGDLVLIHRPQMLKGRSPYMGPFRVTKVLRQYTYLMSNGQKWNY